MIFYILLSLTAVLGGCLGAALSHVPGKRGQTVLTALLLIPAAVGLFGGALCLLARSTDLATVCDRFFPDRLSKLVGCGLLLLLTCALGLLAGVLRANGLRRYLRLSAGSRPHRLAGRVLPAAVLAVILGCAVLAEEPASTPIRLNEVCCANFTLLTDPDTGEYGDYIELVNAGDQPADLGGCFLSDQAKKRSRFRLPALTLQPGECVVLWADGTGRRGTGIHLNFTLQPGETVWFSSPHGILLDHVTVPDRYKNISLSRLEGSWALAQGTPGKGNDDAMLFTAPALPAPTLSLPGGFYTAPQSLTITAAPGCIIRYTLDGSVPTEDSEVYAEPLTLRDICSEPNRVVSQKNTTVDRSGAITEPVDKGTVLRAAAFDGTGTRSEPVTAVYFIGNAFAAYEGKAVLSLVADPLDLFGYYGICVTGPDYDRWLESGGEGAAPIPNYAQHGRCWERDAELQLWDAAGKSVLAQPCGLRLQGNSSRQLAIKRFTLYARPFYGTASVFSAPLFSGLTQHSVSTRPNVHDVMAQTLCAGLGLGGLDTLPVSVFLNGEHYSESFLRERYDARYFETHYGVQPDDLVVIADDALDTGTAADYAAYRALMDYLQTHDCADPAVYGTVCAQIDVENYAAFVAANLYLNNTDWSIYKNYRLWRTRSTDGEGVKDGRWRWLVYDMDACYWSRAAFGDAPRASYNLFDYPAPYTDAPFSEIPVFRDLMRSERFRALFAQTWQTMADDWFSYDRALPLLERFSLTEDEFWPEFLRERPRYADEILTSVLERYASAGQ